MDFDDLILPWKKFHDSKWNHDYFFNPATGESLWTLPESVKQDIESKKKERKNSLKNPNAPKPTQQRFHPLSSIETQRKMFISLSESQKKMPARIQRLKDSNENVSYRQGTEEYNIWFDKYISDNNKKPNERAEYRCDPEIDSGYTKADIYEKDTSYYCVYFVHGECTEGHNCRFMHQIPLYSKCLDFPNDKDIFGRTRFASHRDDRAGVGSFMNDTRSLFVRGFSIPKSSDGTKIIYEILWRHFAVWGEVEDININPKKAFAFVRYSHRCMAEFAKEGMSNQPLDGSENLIIKWANEDSSGKSQDEVKRRAEAVIENFVVKKVKTEINQILTSKQKKDQEILSQALLKASADAQTMDQPLSFSAFK